MIADDSGNDGNISKVLYVHGRATASAYPSKMHSSQR
jgi:hypothetical protein